MFTLSIHTSAISKVSKELAVGLLSAAIFSSSALAGDYIPGKLTAAIPAGHVLYKKLHVKDGYGTQNYVCVQKADGTFAWSFFGPQATLFKGGTQAATHFLNTNADLNSLDKGKLQASWQDSDDTSKVWAAAIATATNADDPVIAVNAIPWLTLQVKGSLAGPTGGNNLLKTTYIQRINTVAGLAPDPLSPESLCDATHIATRFLVPYQTDYLFYKPAK
jgi:hypothetical protein